MLLILNLMSFLTRVMDFFWSVFSRIRTEYGEIFCISQFSVRVRENTDQKDFECEHFLCSDRCSSLWHICFSDTTLLLWIVPTFFKRDEKVQIKKWDLIMQTICEISLTFIVCFLLLNTVVQLLAKLNVYC